MFCRGWRIANTKKSHKHCRWKLNLKVELSVSFPAALLFSNCCVLRSSIISKKLSLICEMEVKKRATFGFEGYPETDFVAKRGRTRKDLVRIQARSCFSFTTLRVPLHSCYAKRTSLSNPCRPPHRPHPHHIFVLCLKRVHTNHTYHAREGTRSFPNRMLTFFFAHRPTRPQQQLLNSCNSIMLSCWTK